jgi:cell division protein FtsW (lipid II flippase)
VKNRFQTGKKNSPIDQTQGKLLTIAFLIILILASVLSISPMVRYHGEANSYRFDHWVGVLVWLTAFLLLHYQSSKKLQGRDPFILPVVALLTGIGLLTIWRLYPNMGLRQSIWIAFASTLVLLGFNFPVFIDYIRRYKYIWLISGLLLTGLTFFLGTNPSGNGPALWLKFLGIHFQPSEFLKIILITYLASFFTDQLVVVYRKISVLLPTVFAIGIAVVLLVVQRDLGTAIIFVLIYFGIIYSTKGNKIFLFATPLLALATIIIAYLSVDIVHLRFNAWLNPFGDPSGTSYQIIQSMIAIAEGGLIGAGFGMGSPSLIPVSLSDFIYSAIVEELGLLGGLLIISLFIILIFRGIKLVMTTQYSFDRYLALGLVFYFGVQSILIIGGNIGLLPLTGVTLPFVSYGGSSLVVSFIAMLLLMIISDRTPKESQNQIVNLRRPAVLSSFLIFVLGFEIIVTSLQSFWFSSSLIERPENPRWVIQDRFSERGNILDRDNEVIITNTGQRGSYQRESNHIPLYPIIGYTNAVYGQTGIEESMYPYLRGLEGYPPLEIFWQDLLYNQPPAGLDIRLTIDLDLQKTADAFLGDQPGAVILMNAQSGEILTMASHPYFDAKDLEENWENLIVDQDAPLINRATQGLYPPGTTLFPFIAATRVDLIQQNDTPGSIFEGSMPLNSCAVYPGTELTWQSAIANGCQSVQVQLAENTGVNNLIEMFQSLGFFIPPDIQLNVAEADSPKFDTPEKLYQGQGAFNISPLQMALAASAITNRGILPAPRIVNAYKDSAGDWVTLPKLGQNTQAIEVENAEWLSNLIKSPDMPIWQVTSKVITEEDQVITWFIAGTTTAWQGQPTTVVVLLERDASSQAEEIGLNLLEQSVQSASSANIQK